MIIRVAVTALIIAVFTGGCRSDVSRQPVADSTMVNLLVALHLANGRIEVTDRPLPIDRDEILRAHGVDSSAYATMMEYYAEHPEEYSHIYGRVLDKLSADRIHETWADTTHQGPLPPDTFDQPFN